MNQTQQSTAPLVVGVGASAGGLEAFQELLAAIGDAQGMAIVLVQHLGSASRSLLPELLSHVTALPVRPIEGKTTLAPATIYVCPPHQLLELKNGNISLADTDSEVRPPAPIDHFFHAIAEDQLDRGVGIILSGAGSDGTLGLKAISDRGGLTFAQDPTTAKFDSMPRSAATTGVADHVLRPSEIAKELVQYAKYLGILDDGRGKSRLQDEIQAAIPIIAETLFKATDHNFQHYKNSTLRRRIQRRMQILKITSASDYVSFLQHHATETQTLFRELLIGVTAFFRDPDAFDVLREQVLNKLIERRSPGDGVRIWVAGCANGAEAYTMAILCRELMEMLDKPPELRIFATDIDERALQIARAGIYPTGIKEQVTPERLQRFFVRRGNQYQVAKEIRDLVLFSTHNLISDPPFSRQDLICCRNLLIYLGSHLQHKLIPLFHYAIRPGGYLFLGPSENIASHGELFREIDAKHRISQRKGTAIGQTRTPRHREPGIGMREISELEPEAAVDLTEVRQRILLDEFAPKSCIIDDSGQVLNAAANMNKFLSIGDGDFQNNILKMAASGLRIGLRAAIAEAKTTRRKVQHENLSIRDGDFVQRVMLTVQPMPRLGEAEPLLMVVFHEVGLPVNRDAVNEAGGQVGQSSDADSMLLQMERELEAVRHDLDRSMQDMEAANEELKSSNEELLSMNEELQSANEELETSKEEIRISSDAVAAANSDLENLFRSTQIATMFLDTDGKIIRFTPAATEIYNLITTDIGRRLTDITHRAIQMPLEPQLATIMSANRPLEDEIQLKSGKWFMRRLFPYLRGDKPRGIIVTFIDVTAHKRAAIRSVTEHQVAKLLVNADSLSSVMPKILLSIRQSLDADFSALWTKDPHSQELVCTEDSLKNGDVELAHFAATNRETRFARGEGQPGRVWLSVTADWIDDVAERADFKRPAAIEAGLVSAMAMPIVNGTECVGVIEVFTKQRLERDEFLLTMLESIGAEIGQFISRRQLNANLRDEEARKSAILASALDAIITMNVEGEIVDFNPAAERIFGYRKDDVQGHTLAEIIIPPELREAHTRGLKRFLETGQSNVLGRRIELVAQRSGGEQFPVELAISVNQTLDEKPFFTAYLRDITEHKQFIATIHERDEQIVALLNSTAEGIYGIDRHGNCTFANASCLRLLGYASIDELIGQQMHRLIHHSRPDGQDYPSEECHIYEAFRTGERVHCDDELFWRADGSAFDVEYWSYPIIRGDEAIGCVVTFLDVTERRRWQREQSKRERQLSLALEAGKLGSWEWDVPSSRITWSDRLHEMYGYTRNEFKGTPEGFMEIVLAEDRGIVQARIDSILYSDSQREQFEVRSRRGTDGETIWTDIHGLVERDNQGRALRITGFAVDTTARKRRELALAFFADLQDEITALTSAEDIMRVATQRLADYLELSRCVLIRTDEQANTAEVFYEHRDNEMPSLLGFYDMKLFWNDEERTQFALGKTLQINDTAGPTRSAESAAQFRALNIRAIANAPANSDQQLAFIVCALKALPHIWQADELELLSSLSTSLYLRIERAKAENAMRESERRMSIVREQAIAANASKSAFLANMSHEIRTPMTAILGYTDLIAERVNDDETISHVRTIRRNGDFLLEIINDILDLSKIEADKLEISQVRFSPHRLVEDVRSIMEVRATEGRLALDVEYRGLIPAEIESDPKRLKQILINLVGNAIKFTPQGRVQISVGYLDHSLQFDIVDTGIGMSEMQLQRLFQPFSQGDSNVNREFGGTGLGLAISKRLTEMLGGEISVESTLNKGSRFTISIDVGTLANVDLIQPRMLNDLTPNPAMAKAIELNCSILVVDDRRDIRFLSKTLLNAAGAKVSEAEDGEMAIKMVEEMISRGKSYDLILLDMQMPRLDGYQTAEQLRKLGVSEPIIALTADAMQGDMRRCIQSGCNDYLSKPIDKALMLQMVSRYVQAGQLS